MNNTKKAREAYREGKYEKSGDLYTQAAYMTLSHNAISDAVDGQIAAGLFALLRSAWVYRRAEKPARATNRCRQGVLIASDIQENVVTDTAREGILAEYIGDFKLLGEMQDSTDVYEEAETTYVDAGLESSFAWPSNPLVDKNVTFLTWICSENGISVQEEQDIEYDFLNRLSYKRSHLQSLIENG